MEKQAVIFLVMVIVASVAFTSCENNMEYEKTKSGIMYKLFSNSKDGPVKTGSIIKINFWIKTGSTDSLIETSIGRGPVYIPIEGIVTDDEYSPFEVFNKFHKGDSAIIVQMIDSLTKFNHVGALPAFFKKGDYLTTTIKVLNVFTSQDSANFDKIVEMGKERVRIEQEVTTDLVKANVEMEAWINSRNISAIKTGRGTYVAMKEQGTGLQADSGKYVTVRFEGRTLADGKVFQTMMDSASEPFTFQVGVGDVMPGWDEGLKLFKKGGKGTLYIPGPLTYGKNPPQGTSFKPNEAMIFDIYVLDISDKKPIPIPRQQMIPEIRAKEK